MQNTNKFPQSLKVLNQSLKTLQAIMGGMEVLNETIEDLDTKLAKETAVVEAELKPATIADVEKIVKRNFENQSVGYLECGLSCNLKADKAYGFCIYDAMLVGNNLQLVVQFYEATTDGRYSNNGRPVGLIVQNYRVGSFEYREMVEAVYSPPFPMLIAVNTDEFEDVIGAIKLKECQDTLTLDWRTFIPVQTPCSNKWDFSKKFIEEMN